MRVATWNMQGAATDADSKWNIGVQHLLANDEVEVLLLQECGAPPPGAAAALLPGNWIGAAPFPGACSAWTYQVGGSWRGARYQIIHVAWHPPGVSERCNLAVVTRAPPVACFYIENPLDPSSRPAIGVVALHPVRGQVLLGSLHAFSGGGNDGPGFLRHTEFLSHMIGGRPWFCGGDFNRAPATWGPGSAPAGASIWHPRAPTQMAGGELDYAWSSAAAGATRALPGTSSDHIPVLFDF